MRILFINDMYTVGGATMALKELLLRLKADGHEPIVCTSVHDSFNDFLDANGIQNLPDGHISVMDVTRRLLRHSSLYFHYRKRQYQAAMQHALELIPQRIDMHSIDLIHTNSIRNDEGCFLSQKYRIPHVMHIREFGAEDFACSVFAPDYYASLNGRCDVLLAVSEAVRRSSIRKGVLPEKVQTLYDGVVFDGFSVKEQNTLTEGKLRVVIVGGVCETKGQHIAVQALGALPEEIRRHVTLDIIGWEGRIYRSLLDCMIHVLHLEQQVRFLGTRDDIGQLLAGYNIGLMCSKSEGFGRVTAEYMYAGLGVIAADTGASPELVCNGKTGLMYHRDDPKSLADRITQLYRDPALRSRLSRNAHRAAERRFSAEINYQKTLEVYRKVLAGAV